MPEFITDLIIPIIEDGYIIALAVFVLAEIIKKSLKFINIDYIPLIGGTFGAILGVIISHIFPNDTVIVSAIKGLTIGWAVTGGFETFKNLKNMTKQK